MEVLVDSASMEQSGQETGAHFKPSQLAQSFIAALRKAEETKDLQDLMALFSDDAIVSSVGRATALQGRGAAERFWSAYLDQFGTIESQFLNLIEGEGEAVLEWVSTGTTRNGHALEYHGVSILSHDGKRIGSFRTYFDTAAFARHAA